MKLNDVKIGPKLIGGFIMVVAVSLVMGVLGIINIRRIDSSNTATHEEITDSIGDLQEIGQNFHKVRIDLLEMVNAGDDDEMRRKESDIQELRKGITRCSDDLNRRIASHRSLEAAHEGFKNARKEYVRDLEEMIALMLRHRTAEATRLMYGRAADTMAAEMQAIDRLTKLLSEESDRKSVENTRQAGRAVAMMAIAMTIGLLGAMGLGIYLTISITRPMKQGVEMIKELERGHLGVRLRMGRRDEIGVLADTMDEFADDLQENVVGALKRVAAGDVSMEVKSKDAQDEINPALEQMIMALRGLVSDMETLSSAAVEGKMGARADASKQNGSFKKIIEGVNRTLDSIIGNIDAIPTPIQFMDKELRIQYINDSGAKLLGGTKQSLQGKKCADLWNTTKCRTNGCPCHVAMEQDNVFTCENDGTINGQHADIFCASAPLHDEKGRIIGSFEFVTDQTAIKQAARTAEKVNEYQGREVEKLVGRLGELAQGNLAFDLTVADGDEATRTVRQNFIKINESLQKARSAIEALVRDADALAVIAVEGQLSARADATRHQGDYRKIVEGLNRLLDAVARPMLLSIEHLEHLSQGIVDEHIEREYSGDFNRLKVSFNSCFATINSLVADANMLAAAAVEGKLATRADDAKHRGDFKKIIEGVNQTLDAVLNPIQDAAGVLDKMAHNDFTQYITKEYHGDHALISHNINKVLDTLNESLQQVTEATQQVASTTQELSATAQQMASGSEEQTSQTSQVATSMEEMSATIQQVAKNSGTAAEKSKEAGSTAIKGGQIVEQTVKGITNIELSVRELQGVIRGLSENSARIGDVVNVIDDVAEQTNLLALNAAIEAARAGEQGRGFAVVADEVRKLAERTTTSTKEIADMVKSIQGDTARAVSSMDASAREVGDGVKYANEAGAALQEIVREAKVVEEMVQQIATAAEQQSAAASEITANIESISAVSKQSADGAQQTAQASQDLGQLTEKLQTLVGKFAIKNSEKTDIAGGSKRKQETSHQPGDGHEQPKAA